MLKFFAKYQKIILVVGGSVLMVMFLLPGVGLMTPGAEVVTLGTIGQRTITSQDRQDAAAELDILAAVQRTLQIHAATHRNARLSPMLEVLSQQQVPGDPMQWLLLTAEAERHGIYIPQLEAEQILLEMNSQGVEIGRLVAAGNRETLLDALCHWRMFLDFATAMGGAAPPSEGRLRHFARDFRSMAKVQYVVLDPKKILEKTDEPTEEQLKELFEKHKEKPPGETEPYGFGYKLPKRVKLEYIGVPLKRVAESIAIDEVDAQRYYRDHPEEFLPPPPPPPSLIPDLIKDKAETKKESAPKEEPKKDEGKKTEEKPAEPSPAPEKKGDKCEEPPAKEPAAKDEPVKPEGELKGETKVGDKPAVPALDPKKPLPYREVREKVIEKLRDSKARAKMAAVTKTINDLMQKDVAALPMDEKGYRKLEGHKALSLDEVAKKVQEEHGLLPDVVRIENVWQSLEEISKIEGFGKAGLSTPEFPISVYAYIASLPEVKHEQAAARFGSLKLQVGVGSRPVEDYDGNAYVFRVLAAEAERVPEKLDEVKDLVVRDFKEKAAYESLKGRLDTLRDRAGKEGLEALAKQYDVKVEEAGPFSASEEFSMPLPVIGRSKAFTEKVFELAAKVEEAGGVAKAEPAQLVTAVGVDTIQKVALVKLTEYEPVDSVAYGLWRPMLPQYIAQTETRNVKRGEGPFTIESLSKRLKFVEAKAAEEEKPVEKAKEGEKKEEEKDEAGSY